MLLSKFFTAVALFFIYRSPFFEKIGGVEAVFCRAFSAQKSDLFRGKPDLEKTISIVVKIISNLKKIISNII